jgi:hypothetical protein
VEKLLEDAQIKISSVLSDIFGVSSRAMMEALIGGERDARVIADLAERRARHKLTELERALDGFFTPHHARLLRMMLDNGEELRVMGPALWAAAAYGRREDWGGCIPAFRDVNLRDADWDIPYLWFAIFLDSKGRTASAIALLRNASTYCRRKSVLLRKAGEFCLFNGEVRLSLHLLAQAVAANPVPPRREDTGYLGLYCYLEVMLEELGDPEGAAWASNVQSYLYIDDSLKNRIRNAVTAASVADRTLLLEEAPKISAALSRLMGSLRDTEPPR